MKRRLFLHIGVHRTGTTSIQRFMQKNFGMLLQKGIFHPYAVPRHFAMMGDIFSHGTSIAEIARDIHQRADGKAHPIDTVVLSDEDICTRAEPAVLGQFSDHFEVKVVLLVRRQDLWLESWYSQNVKWQWNPALAHLPFDAFLANRARFFWIDYDRTVRRFERIFGAGNVICRPFETEQMPEGPVQAFCDEIGLTDFTGLTQVPPVNRSLSPLMTEFMRTLPLDAMPEYLRRKFEDACIRADAAVTAHVGPQSTLLMDADTRARVMAEYDASNATLARRMFGRDALFLAPRPAADAPLATRTLPADSYDTIDMIVAPVVVELARRMLEDDARATEGKPAAPATP